MELPPKALHALIDIKKELLSPREVEEVPEKSQEKAAPPATFNQRHARPSSAYQRGCQRHNFWSPVR